MAIKGVVEVTEIEQQKGKQGPWIKIHYTDKKGPHKLAVFEPSLVSVFKGKGSYYIEVDKPEGEQFWKLIKAESRAPGSGTSSPAPVSGEDSKRGRSIQIQTAMKATAEVLASLVKAGETTLEQVQQAIPGIITAFVDAADAIERADKEAKDMGEAAPF